MEAALGVQLVVVLAGAGSWAAKADAIGKGKFQAIEPEFHRAQEWIEFSPTLPSAGRYIGWTIDVAAARLTAF
jgi:hypothetical protein